MQKAVPANGLMGSQVLLFQSLLFGYCVLTEANTHHLLTHLLICTALVEMARQGIAQGFCVLGTWLLQNYFETHVVTF